MKVLVTGSAGFIGRYVNTELVFRGHELVPFDQPVHDVRALVPQHLDGIDAIINLAGVLGTPELLGSEHRAADVNILGAIRVYDVAAQRGIPVVQIGTGHKGQPNPYAITKACAEDLGLSRAQWLGDKITIVRAYHVYGDGQGVGPPHGRASVHKFFPTFACRALTCMPLLLCGGGEQEIDPVHASEVATVLVDAIHGPYGTVREAGCGKAITVRQIAGDILTEADAVRRCEPGLYTPTITAVAARPGEPLGARVVAEKPECQNLWPYQVKETVQWYRTWLSTQRP